MNALIYPLIAIALTGCSTPHVDPTVSYVHSGPMYRGGFQVEEPAHIQTLGDENHPLGEVHAFRVVLPMRTAKLTAENRKALNGVIGMLEMEPNNTIHLVGHGSFAERVILPQRRALSVAQYLRDHGIAENRIRISWDSKKSYKQGEVILTNQE